MGRYKGDIGEMWGDVGRYRESSEATSTEEKAERRQLTLTLI